jgi:predicted dehydrogenase
MVTQNRKLGVAIVGLSSYANDQIAPALQQTEHCYLAGIVSGTSSSIKDWKERYNIAEKNIYSYENYGSIKNNPEIDIVYILLPNNMHAEYTIRGFEAGKHVICEKPMAITVEDCDRMIAAGKKAGKFLSIGYRLHFDPYHLEMIRLGTDKVYGDIKKISGGFGIPASPDQWRLTKKFAGGGPLMDLGIYVIQAMCYVTGMEPIAVKAVEGKKTDTQKFADVEESVNWQFEFPGGLVGYGETSYSRKMNYLKVEADKGTFELLPAYDYSGIKGHSPAGEMNFKDINQQAKLMDAFAEGIKNNKAHIVPGDMGRRDVKYMQAIYEAMRTGNRITIDT